MQQQQQKQQQQQQQGQEKREVTEKLECECMQYTLHTEAVVLEESGGNEVSDEAVELGHYVGQAVGWRYAVHVGLHLHCRVAQDGLPQVFSA